MRHVILNAREDVAFGGHGLMIQGGYAGESMNPATEGLLVAHDLLEHQNGIEAIGGIGDELEALGGLWYVRGQHGVLRRDNMASMFSAEESIGSDIHNLFRYSQRGVPLRVRVPNTREHFQDEAFDEIIAAGRKDIMAENEYEDYELSGLSTYLEQSKHLLRVGYNKAQRRFEPKGRHYAENQFWAIAEAVDPYAKNLEGWEKFRLSYGDCKAHVEEIYEDY